MFAPLASVILKLKMIQGRRVKLELKKICDETAPF